MLNNKNIQRIELSAYDISIYCPFCGQLIIDQKPDTTNPINPCPHTLFIAHDEGIEYRSTEFDTNLNISGVDTDDLELPEGGFDELTNQVTIQDSIKIAQYVPPPGFMGSYIGFVPK